METRNDMKQRLLPIRFRAFVLVGLLVTLIGLQLHARAVAQPLDKCGTPRSHQLAEVMARRLSYQIMPSEEYAAATKFDLSRSKLDLLIGGGIPAKALAQWYAIKKIADKQAYYHELLRNGKYEHDEDAQETRPLPGQAKLKIIDSLYDEETDTQAFVFQDKKGQKYLVFRGTDSAWDWWLNKGGASKEYAEQFGGVGTPQFQKTRERLEKWSKKHKNVIVIGHSLGGALAQHYIARFPGSVKEGILFNSAGVDTEVAIDFEENTRHGRRPEITYHLDTRDLVSNAGGEMMLEGKVIFHDGEPEDGIQLGNNHTSWMLADDSDKNCKYYPKEQFDEFLRQRTATQTQDIEKIGELIKNSGGYVIESEIGTDNTNEVIDGINGGLDKIDDVIDGIENGVNLPGKGVNKVLDGIEAGLDLLGGFVGLDPDLPRVPTIDIPDTKDGIGRIPGFEGGYIPDYDTAIDPDQQGGGSHSQSPPLPDVYIYRPRGWLTQ